jgi:predicted PurR-regulated permease PerM
MDRSRHDLTRTTLSIIFICGLITAGLLVMRPFLAAIIWAATLVIATWPVMLWVERRAGKRRSAAVAVMTLALLLVLIVPLGLAASAVVDNLDAITALGRSVLTMQVPPPPQWLVGLPLVGAPAARAWEQAASLGLHGAMTWLAPYSGELTHWLAGALGSVGGMFVQFLLTVALAGVMYATGERAAASAIRFGHRLGGERGETVIVLCGQAIRGVALGVVVTAMAQSVLGGVGLAVVGVPFASVLTALMFVLCLAQLGPGLVLVPAVVWLYVADNAMSATMLLAFTVVAMLMDNFLRPVLIRKGADLPLLLILFGVIGGLIAMGLLGIFVGPVVLAVGYTLVNAWMDETDPPETP